MISLITGESSWLWVVIRKTQIVFCQHISEVIALLNANAALDEKRVVMEKTLTDGTAMLASTIEGVERARVMVLATKQKADQLVAINQAEEKAAALKEIAELEAKIQKSEALKAKFEVAIENKKKDIADLSSLALKDDQKKGAHYSG